MSLVFAELIRKNHLSENQFNHSRQQRTILNKSVQDVLFEQGVLKSPTLFKTAQEIFPGKTVNLQETAIDSQAVIMIRREDAQRYGLIPFAKEDGYLSVAMSDPTDVMALDELSFMTGFHVKAFLSDHAQIMEYVQRYYLHQDSVEEILQDTIEDTPVEFIAEEILTSEEIADIAIAKADSSSFVRLVNRLLADAVSARASDIHIEPRDKVVEVRYRIDGYLKNIVRIPRNLHPRLSSRIKILAKLDIAEQRKVQEGRIKVLIKGEKIDLRISVIPIFHGEKIVLRILDNRSTQFDINKIGFSDDELEIFKSAIHKSQGVVLVTGPTGSGKTTTLYSALEHIKCETKNIVTIEDPIEYLIDGINQLQLSRFKDVTFTTGLRSILRQGPDVS
ncbi:MAG: Flp pilus assembly complex ATPase component TadA [Candidatus Omnitrophica bacterium]|nr:Flp pilus assembly complex ATPase component TadA [Candidatus Omnitrophota bacterium]